MIHPDVHVAGRRQPLDGTVENLELGFGCRNVLGGNHALALEALRQMRVVVNGKAVGPHADRDVERLVETLDRLQWQAVNEVERDRLEAGFARGIDERFGLFD